MAGGRDISPVGKPAVEESRPRFLLSELRPCGPTALPVDRQTAGADKRGPSPAFARVEGRTPSWRVGPKGQYPKSHLPTTRLVGRQAAAHSSLISS
jgi:hypothetical protein